MLQLIAMNVWSEERLADLVTRESMIGTGLPKQIDEVAR
jgi:nitrile hydratase